MRPTDKIEEQEWIENFIDKKLSVPESQLFEEELLRDKDFAKEVEKMKALRKTLQDYFVEETMKNKIHELNYRGVNKKQVWLNPFRVVATTIAALIIIVLYLTFSPIVLSDSESDLTVTRGVETIQIDSLQKKSFDYFFDGQSKMVEGQYFEASKKFELVLVNTQLRPYFREATQWHLLIAYMKSKQVEKASNYYSQLKNCELCEYEISTFNRWKIWWQIKLLAFES